MKLPAIQQNLLDRVIGYFNPAAAADRYRARMVMAIAGGYTGGRRDRRQTSSWQPGSGDADAAILPDLATLRDRSRDLERNAPIAAGAINTKVTSVVGTGLKPRASIDRDVLTGLTEEQADGWERAAEREFRLATAGKDFDIERGHNFLQSQDLVFRSTLSAGDIFVNLPRKARTGNPYTLRVNFIEADRVCNPQGRADSTTLTAGIEKDEDGAPKTVHVTKHHPGNLTKGTKREWLEIPVYNRAGRRQILHIYRKLRPGQTRGVPDLAPVVELLKQFTTLTENELHASTVNSLFTVFIKTATGNPAINMVPATGQQPLVPDTRDIRLGSGNVLGLRSDESVEFADPKRPNVAVEAFLRAMAEQIGVALELPFELLVKHFTASYSAARAALLEAWRFYLRSRAWLADEYCQPIWEEIITEAVARGRLAAPGFFADPLVRMAYLGCEWTGDAPGQINEGDAVDAAAKRVDLGVSTLAEETAALTGGDWERKHPQRAKERRMRLAAGLEEAATADAPAVPPVPEPEDTPDTEDAA
jgi:lambda family phage portal protein